MNLPNNNVWQNRLTRNMNGEALCTMPNIALILKSDPNLKNIVFNESDDIKEYLLEGYELTKPLLSIYKKMEI